MKKMTVKKVEPQAMPRCELSSCKNDAFLYLGLPSDTRMFGLGIQLCKVCAHNVVGSITSVLEEEGGK